MDLFIIAEIGINHNGSLKEAFKLVDAAKKAGAEILSTANEIYSKSEFIVKVKEPQKEEFSLIRKKCKDLILRAKTASCKEKSTYQLLGELLKSFGICH